MVGAAHLVPQVKLDAARDDHFPPLAAFPSALGMLAALRATHSGDQVDNVLISNVARWGGEGPAVSATLADWEAWLEHGDFLMLVYSAREQCAERLWKDMEALPEMAPFTTVAMTMACTTDVPGNVRSALLEVAGRTTFLVGVVAAMATAARSEH